MIRYSLLILAVTFLSGYAFRDWYKSLCGVVVLMAFIERYDMPRQMLGVTGLNPWNVLMLFVVFGCVAAAKKENLTWDLPQPTKRLIQIYFVVVAIGIVRLAGDYGQLQSFYADQGRQAAPLLSFVFDDFLNTLKYAVPGMLMFYGCNTRSRLQLGMAACLLTAFLLGLQIIKWMPIGQLANADILSDTALRLLDRAIGYHRVDLAALMAGASWGFFVVRPLAPNKAISWCLTAAGVILILALALTGGRTGYGTWLVLAAIFTAVKWRRLIFVVPVMLFIVIAIVPAARDRMMYGFTSSDDESGFTYEDDGTDFAKVTSDRVLIWPIVIDEIGKSPLVGFGRHGLILSNAGRRMRDLYGEKGALTHPHNAYLELLIDNGILGALPIFYFFFIVSKYSIGLFRRKGSPLLAACGGFGLAMVSGQLIASIGGQSFYPRAGVVVMWCAIGLVLRAYVFLQRESEATSLST